MREGKEQVLSFINEAKNIAVMGHKSGDADSFGSMCALKVGLEKMGKNVELYADKDLPKDLNFFREACPFVFHNEYLNDIDLLILVDSAEEKILSYPEYFVKHQKENVRVIQIDHHQKGNLAEKVDVSWRESEYSATCELIYFLLKDLDIDFEKRLASILLAGIQSDTNNFQNQNTSSQTFTISSHLMKYGARPAVINTNLDSRSSVEHLKLIGLALERLTINNKYDAAVTFLSYKDAIKIGISENELGNIANFLNSIKGARIIVFIREKSDGEIYVSFRTRDKNVDVSKLAQILGGGGHIKAAGVSFPGEIELINNIVKIT